MASIAQHGSSTAPRYQIHHYPAGLIETRALAGAGQLTLRPVLPQDAPLLAALVARLSPAARRWRFHGAGVLSYPQLQQMSCVDYRRQLALVITAQLEGHEQLLADARYSVDDDGQGADFAVLVDERWQRHGLGRWAMSTLQRAADVAGLQWLHGEVLHSNAPMQALMRRCGFALSPDPDDEQLLHAQRRLGKHAIEIPATAGGLVRWLRRALPGRSPVHGR